MLFNELLQTRALRNGYTQAEKITISNGVQLLPPVPRVENLGFGGWGDEDWLSRGTEVTKTSWNHI